MSMLPKKLETVDARAAHVLASQGKASIVLRCMSDENKQKLAEMVTPGGLLTAGIQEKVRLLLLDHYESLKASDAELDEPANVAEQQMVQELAKRELSGRPVPPPRLAQVKEHLLHLADMAQKAAESLKAKKRAKADEPQDPEPSE